MLFADIHELLQILEDLHFTDEDIAFLRELNFHPSYIDYLKGFQFRSSVYAVSEVIFSNCPVLRVEGSLFEAQLMIVVTWPGFQRLHEKVIPSLCINFTYIFTNKTK